MMSSLMNLEILFFFFHYSAHSVELPAFHVSSVIVSDIENHHHHPNTFQSLIQSK